MTPAEALKRIAEAYGAAPTAFHPPHWTRSQPEPRQLQDWQDLFTGLTTDQLDIAALQCLSDLQTTYASRRAPEFLARVTALDAAMQARGYIPSADYIDGWRQGAAIGAPPDPEVTEADAEGRPALAARLAAFSDDTLRGFDDYVVNCWMQWRHEFRIFDVMAPSPYGPILDAIFAEKDSRRHTAHAPSAGSKTAARLTNSSSRDFPAHPPAPAPVDTHRRAYRPSSPPSSNRGPRK